jgi:hypothetical protein
MVDDARTRERKRERPVDRARGIDENKWPSDSMELRNESRNKKLDVK